MAGPDAAFAQGLQRFGLDRRPQPADRLSLGGGGPDAIRRYAAELAALAPDVIFATGSIVVPLCKRAYHTDRVRAGIDPVGSGFVESLARPGGNATGFTLFEYGLSGKWLELLQGIVPRVDARGGHS